MAHLGRKAAAKYRTVHKVWLDSCARFSSQAALIYTSPSRGGK